MKKEEFKLLKYNKEPVFNKDYITIGIPCVTNTTYDNHTITRFFSLDEKMKPTYSIYRNGKRQYSESFETLDQLKEMIELQKGLLKDFCEWMEMYEKNHAKIVSINNK